MPELIIERQLFIKKTYIFLSRRFALENCKRPNWNIVYDFVADRLRAVRKDLVVQGLHGQDVLPVLEPMVFFHVYAGYRYLNKHFFYFTKI